MIVGFNKVKVIVIFSNFSEVVREKSLIVGGLRENGRR